MLAFTGFLMALAVGLLLTAGVNIGSLLLARATERRAENGLRLALGATRWRLVVNTSSRACSWQVPARPGER